jgi:hypothetical protein
VVQRASVVRGSAATAVLRLSFVRIAAPFNRPGHHQLHPTFGSRRSRLRGRWLALEGERKTVTALFADIKSSTELMRDLDPEGGARDHRSGVAPDDRRGTSLRRLHRAIHWRRDFALFGVAGASFDRRG